MQGHDHSAELVKGYVSSDRPNEGDTRHALIKAGAAACMIALAGHLFCAIRILSCLWLLARNRKAVGTGAAWCSPLTHGNSDKWRPEHNLAKSMWYGIHR